MNEIINLLSRPPRLSLSIPDLPFRSSSALQKERTSMRDFFTLGPVPSDEPCAKVGEPDYRMRAVPECQRFIELLRRVFGPEPE